MEALCLFLWFGLVRIGGKHAGRSTTVHGASLVAAGRCSSSHVNDNAPDRGWFSGRLAPGHGLRRKRIRRV